VAATSSRSQVTALIVASAFFMEQLDGTVIATSLPQIAATFGVRAIDVAIGMTAYLVTLAAFIPLSGWISDRIGARTTFCWAIVLFVVTSMICGSCANLTEFVLARIAQGAAGAMMVPVGRTLVLRSSEKHELLRSVSFITWPGLIAPVLGPPIGGFITTYASWRWIFFLNVPIGIAGLVLALAFIAPVAVIERRPFDLRGFVLTATALIAVMFGLDLIARGGNAAAGAGLLLAGFAVGAVAIHHLRTAAAPILSLAAAAIPTFAAATFRGGNYFRIAIQMTPFLLPLLFQVGFGRTAFASGLLMLAYAAGNLGMKTVTTRVLKRFGFRRVVIVNGAIVTLSLLACALLSPHTADAAIAAVLFAAGLCRSMQFTTITTLGFVDVQPALMSGASTLSSTLTQLATGAAIALGALLLHAAAVATGTAPVIGIVDFRIAFAASSLLALAATLSLLSLPRSAGADVSGARAAS
jgi:EmrB/QacA subfamily drug resistance transporter